MSAAQGPLRDSQADARVLREASRVLLFRARQLTFSLRVVIRVLERSADRIERGGTE